jgi:hypothetical protein
MQGGHLSHVIFTVDANGREEFAEQEAGEVRWHAFVPCAREKEAADRLRAAGKGKDGWAAYVDVDDPGDDVASQRLVGWENFREFMSSRLVELSGLQIDATCESQRQLTQEVDTHLEKGQRLIREVSRWLRRHQALVQEVAAENGSALEGARGQSPAPGLHLGAV